LPARAVRDLTTEAEALLGFVEPDASASVRFDEPVSV
jgi:hypothetical protein